MINKFFLLHFLMLYSVCFGQNSKAPDSSYIVCKYNVIFLKDTTDVTSKKEEVMTLQIGKNVSLFKSDQKHITDSLQRISADNSFKNAVNNHIILDFGKIPKSNFFQEVYSKNGKVKIFDKVFNQVYSFEPINKASWKLVDEKKVINTYKCKKAIGVYGKRKWIAWYTDDIPISEGPYNFKGLPGLIVEISDEKEFYHFTLNYLKKSKVPIVPISRSLETDYYKFSEKRKDVRDNPLQYLNQIMNKPLSVDKNNEEDMKRNLRKKNNYLD